MQEVVLYPCTSNTVAKLISWGKRQDLAEFFRHFPPYYEWMKNVPLLEGIQANSLEIKSNHEVVGIVTLSHVNDQARSVAVSVLVDSPFHKEIASQVYSLIQDYVFREKGYKRIEVKILDHRTKLKERLESIGFVLEGTLKSSCRLGMEWRDEFVLGLVK